MILNDKKLSWPDSGIGEAVHSVALQLDTADLKVGQNTLSFSFDSNLNNTTVGYDIIAARLLLYKQLTEEQKDCIFLNAKTWEGL